MGLDSRKRKKKVKHQINSKPSLKPFSSKAAKTRLQMKPHRGFTTDPKGTKAKPGKKGFHHQPQRHESKASKKGVSPPTPKAQKASKQGVSPPTPKARKQSKQKRGFRLCFVLNNKAFKTESSEKIPWEKWAAFRPCLKANIWKANELKKLSRKNGQHFGLF